MTLETLHKEALAAVEKTEQQVVADLHGDLKEGDWENAADYLAGARLLERARRALEAGEAKGLPRPLPEDQGGIMPPDPSPGGPGFGPDLPSRRRTREAEEAIQRLLSAVAGEGNWFEIRRAYRAWENIVAAGDELPRVVDLDLEKGKAAAG